MTPRYTWTPASEPPSDGRRVQIWIACKQATDWGSGCFYNGKRWEIWSDCDLDKRWAVTHWRDVEPPKDAP